MNGAPGGFNGKPLFSVKRGTPVSLGFLNKTLATLNMRVHGHVVRLLHDLDDGWEPYWRNAVIVAEGRTKHVAFVADNPGKWAIALRRHRAPDQRPERLVRGDVNVSPACRETRSRAHKVPPNPSGSRPVSRAALW